jgi:hypothetical protein
MQLIFEPMEGLKGFTFSRGTVQASASASRLKHGEVVEVKEGSVVALLAGEGSDKYWFFRLLHDVIRDASGWVTKRMRGTYLERDTASEAYYFGQQDSVSVKSLITAVDCDFENDDPSRPLVMIKTDTADIDDVVATLRELRQASSVLEEEEAAGKQK